MQSLLRWVKASSFAAGSPPLAGSASKREERKRKSVGDEFKDMLKSRALYGVGGKHVDSKKVGGAPADPKKVGGFFRKNPGYPGRRFGLPRLALD